MQRLPGIEMPQRLTCGTIHGFEGLRIIAEEDEASCGGHYPAHRMGSADLRILPREFAGLKVIGKQ